jgi:hypothetical protein
VSYTEADYRLAQTVMWGQAGEWAADTFARLNATYFGDEVPAAGIAWGLTPRGRLGHTNYESGRITLHSSLLDPRSANPWYQWGRLGEAFAEDVLLHEMIHCLLRARGVPSDEKTGRHNEQPWCDEIMRLAPLIGLGEVKAAPVKPRRIDGAVRRQALDGYLTQDELARFPHPLRPAGWYEARNSRQRIRI